MALHTVKFLPFGKTVSVESGTTLLEAAGRADIVLNSLCGGQGVCGRCRMTVLNGTVGGEASSLLSPNEAARGVVLSCMAAVESDLEVEIPEEAGAGDRLVLDQEAQRFRATQAGMTDSDYANSPMLRKLFLQLDPPSLENNLADAQRLQRAVEKTANLGSVSIMASVLQDLPGVLRDGGFAVTVTLCRTGDGVAVIGVASGDSAAEAYAAAVDIGTTTVVAHLLNMATLETVDSQACFNSQSVHGREVTARIMASEKKGVPELQSLVVGDINRLLSILAERNGLEQRDIMCLVCAGNTVMNHFLLGLPCGNIRREPYVAVSVEPGPVYASELGIEMGDSASVYSVPGISGWVGGDLSAGILAVGLHRRDEVAMLIDVGTNGEIIVGNSDWLMACSASTGPALEGASVECGMMAENGAVERVWAEGDEFKFKTIGDVAPEGICGSGIIDLVAVMLKLGIIDRGGKLVEGSHPGVSASGAASVFTLTDRVSMSQDDIENIVTAKAAVFAAAKIMMDRVSMEFSELSQLYIAGGFGAYIDCDNAVRIGLLPDLPRSDIQYAGNTSIWGAKLAAFSAEACDALRDIRRRTTYYDLMGAQDYVEQFQQARFLPHTDLQLFPSLTEKADGGME